MTRDVVYIFLSIVFLLCLSRSSVYPELCSVSFGSMPTCCSTAITNRQQKERYWWLMGEHKLQYLFGKMHAWGKWCVACMFVNVSWLFFFVFSKSTVLLSVLPTLDNLLVGFRQLGAKNKIRDVLYYQVKFMFSYQSMFVQTFYNYSLKDACAISCLMYTDTTKQKLFYFLTIQARIYDELGYLAERNQCATECHWILRQQTNTAIALALCVL